MDTIITNTTWTSVLDILRKQINPQSFDLWLKDTQYHTHRGNTLIIKVIDEVASKHIKQHYTYQIESVLKSVTNNDVVCEFISDADVQSSIETNSLPENTQATLNFNTDTSPQLNPNYTFDTFVIGPNNQFAHAAAKSVAQSPASNYNPLFFWGASGVGKTHLMTAIGNDLLKSREYLNVKYVHTDDFTSEYVYAIRTNTTESFKIKYLNVDILLIDDIQFLEKREGTQDLFFQIFNSLHQNHKQIVISSDRPPKELKTLKDRLKTRFEGGMLIDLQPPNLETREAILRNKADRVDLILSDDVIYYIAKRIRSNIRTLEGAITHLKMISEIINEPLTISHAKQHLKDKFEDDDSIKLSVKDVLVKVASKYNVSISDIKSKSRQNRVVQPRFIAMYICRQVTELTTPEIGSEFGGRDHSTVLNAIKKIEEDISQNVEFQEQIEDLIRELKG